jgi:hypothetical protein
LASSSSALSSACIASTSGTASSTTSPTATDRCAQGQRIRGGGTLRAPGSGGAETHEYYAFIPADWARRWPAEEIWKARKRG